MLAEAGPGKITVLTGRQFDAEARYVVKKGDRIVSIRVLDRTTGREEHYSGAMFIDATYEGDLGAAAGVPFRTGREGAGEYGEPCAGKIYRWWKHGPDADGTPMPCWEAYTDDNHAGMSFVKEGCVPMNGDSELVSFLTADVKKKANK